LSGERRPAGAAPASRLAAGGSSRIEFRFDVCQCRMCERRPKTLRSHEAGVGSRVDEPVGGHLVNVSAANRVLQSANQESCASVAQAGRVRQCLDRRSALGPGREELVERGQIVGTAAEGPLELRRLSEIGGIASRRRVPR
jgi:hypothetical protein